MIFVTKATGEKEPFSEEKVQSSIERAQIPKEIQEQVLAHVKEKIYNDIPTSEIYHHISEFLNKSHPHEKAKYSLKQAIMKLGPTGYPFEDFVSEVLKTQGYTTKVRSIIQGKCITHEVDVVASLQKEKLLIEAKFHNLPGKKTNVHVALYTKARFEDVKDDNNFTNAWIVTNTKTTTDTIAYALCNNMKIVSWSYPDGNGLRDIVEKSGLHPITALNFLSFAQKQVLLQHHVVLCKDIVKNESFLDVLGIDREKREKIIDEAKYLSES